MTDIENGPENEQPLDQLSEALRKKMLRLLVISIGTMLIGIFAVLFAIVYKINNPENGGGEIDTVVTTPPGFVVEQSEINDGILMLRGTGPGSDHTILLFDLTTGAPRGKISID